ncbi:hypothetical protein PSCICG_04190 [Pseudomonas cichorii]|nr:hypothetical protein PSCICG_04190 [Pseudomonas cichorii]
MHLIGFGNEYHVHVAVRIQIGGSDMLAVMNRRSEGARFDSQSAMTIIEIQTIHPMLDGYHHIQVPVLVDIDEYRVRCMEARRDGHMGGGCIGEDA